MKKPSAALMGIGGAVINWCPFFATSYKAASPRTILRVTNQ